MPSNPAIPDQSDPAEPGAGCLYVVATPIGNLEDITLRALKVLSRADLIAAEDTRHTRKLLSAHGISTGLISCHEHNEAQRAQILVEKMHAGGRIALVSDAGTPSVSDPGYRLVQAALQAGIPVIPIPGVSAAVTALSVSGLSTEQFFFAGFPVRQKNKRRQQLEALARIAATLVFYQSPRRLRDFVDELIDCLGDRRAVLARELTKLHEEFLRGRLSEIRAVLQERETIRGECTLLVEGTADQAGKVETDHAQDLDEALRQALSAEDRPLSAISKELAARFGLPRKTVYAMALRLRESGQ